MVSKKEYFLAFEMINYAEDDDCEWLYGYKWLNRVCIHWAFMVTNASEDSIIFNNQELFEFYSSVINSDCYGKKLLDISSVSKLKCGWERKWKYKVFFLFGIVIAWYEEQLEIIQAKIEHHKINKHHK